MKKAVIGLGIVLAFLYTFFWIYNHAFINIKVVGANDGKLTYKLVEQKTGQSTSINGEGSEVKKLVRRGEYEVLVTQNETSYYAPVKTKGFLKSVVVDASLRPENKRTFIGSNPGPCMYYGGELLYSYSCSGSYSDLKVHLPATSETPTTTESPAGDSATEFDIGGLTKVGSKNTIMFLGFKDIENDDIPPSLYDLKKEFGYEGRVDLGDLGPSKDYSITTYREGFVAYDSSFENILYYPSAASRPEKIKIASPKDDSLSPSKFSAQNERIAIAYTDASEESELDRDKPTIKTGRTVVQIYTANNTKSYELNNSYSSMSLCGEKYLCLINGRQLIVFDISSDKAVEQFRINEVHSIQNDQGRLVVLKNDSVLTIDLAKQTGYVSYSFGDYKLCGSQGSSDGSGYIICLINTKQERVVLYINTQKPNTDSIDKKILTLLTQPYIDTVSAYGSYIYISPELGEPEYNASTKSYGPNPAIKQKATTSIDSVIKEAGIDQSIYSIINTHP